MDGRWISPYERERQARRDAAMDALSRAKGQADDDDWQTYNEGEDTEVSLQTFATVVWSTEEWINGGTYREARADIIGARLGNVLIDRDTLDAAFPGQVDRIEERLSEEYTARGEA